MLNIDDTTEPRPLILARSAAYSSVRGRVSPSITLSPMCSVDEPLGVVAAVGGVSREMVCMLLDSTDGAGVYAAVLGGAVCSVNGSDGVVGTGWRSTEGLAASIE